mgnify:CR=1 FL=1|jgi:hypothetical protein
MAAASCPRPRSLVLLAAICCSVVQGGGVASRRKFASEDSRKEEATRLFELAVSRRCRWPPLGLDPRCRLVWTLQSVNTDCAA